MIEVKHIKKYFSRPFREPGLIGAVKSLFTRKKIITKAVDDVSFTITDGEIVGYIGSNGAGKSTTIKMMTGILTPSEGEILYDGKRPYDHRDRRSLLKDIGVVFGQRTQLWWDLPLRDSFDLYRDIYEIPKDEYEARPQHLGDHFLLKRHGFDRRGIFLDLHLFRHQTWGDERLFLHPSFHLFDVGALQRQGFRALPRKHLPFFP